MIDIQAVKDGDFVEFKSPFGMNEIGIYKGRLKGLAVGYHEVWVNGSPAAARIVLTSKFIGHEPAIGMGKGRVT